MAPTTVDTTTQPTATGGYDGGGAGEGGSNQRKLARLADGTLLAVHNNGGTYELRYSKDGGTTWSACAAGSNVAGTNGGGAAVVDGDCSLVVARSGSTERVVLAYLGAYSEPGVSFGTRMLVAWGAPNDGRTGVVWSDTDFHAGLYGLDRHIACVAHPEGEGWAIHLVGGYPGLADWRHVAVSAAGVMSLGELVVLGGGVQDGHVEPVVLDFAHTGDGVTPAGSPHLFAAYRSGASVCFRRAVYATGSWTWSTERTIDPAISQYLSRISMVFDGARCVIAYRGDDATLRVRERDAADTMTTTRTPPALADGAVENVSVAHDRYANAYLFASGATSKDPRWSKYSRATDSWSAWTTIEATTVRPGSLTAKARHDGNFVEVLYTTGAVSPYSVRYDPTVALNVAPLAPDWAAASGPRDVAVPLVLPWDVRDDDEPFGDTQGAFRAKRDLAGVVRWWSGAGFTATVQTDVAGSAPSITEAAGWAVDADPARSYYVATRDAAGLWGPYGEALVVTPSAKVEPAITSPADGGTVVVARPTTTATVASSSAWRLEVLSGGGAVLWDSGWRIEPWPGSAVADYDHANGQTYKHRLTTRNPEGLASTPAIVTFTTTFAVPPFPVVTPSLTPTGAITLAIADRPRNVLSGPQADIEIDAHGWAGFVACALTRSTAWAARGLSSLRLQATSANSLVLAALLPAGYPTVVAGRSYTFLARYQNPNATVRKTRHYISWKRADGTISETAPVQAVLRPGSALRVAASGTAPAGAVKADLVIAYTSVASGEFVYVDEVSLIPVAQRQRLDTPYASFEGGRWGVYADTNPGVVLNRRADPLSPTGWALELAIAGMIYEGGIVTVLPEAFALGQTVTVSAWVTPPVGRTVVRFYARDDSNNNTYAYVDVPVTGGVRQRVSAAFVAPANLSCERIYIIPHARNTGEAALSVGEVAMIDTPQVEAGSALTPWQPPYDWEVTSPATTSHELHRREGPIGEGIRIARDLPVGASYTDWAVAGGRHYQYRARARADNGTYADSPWTA